MDRINNNDIVRHFKGKLYQVIANDAYDSESLIKAQKIVENYKLNYIGRPEIVLIKEKI